jgi:hypothetical protein
LESLTPAGSPFEFKRKSSGASNLSAVKNPVALAGADRAYGVSTGQKKTPGTYPIDGLGTRVLKTIWNDDGHFQGFEVAYG